MAVPLDQQLLEGLKYASWRGISAFGVYDSGSETAESVARVGATVDPINYVAILLINHSPFYFQGRRQLA